MTLRIAVLGAGGIGSTFAYQLAKAGGHDVTAIARPGSARLAQLQRDGGVVKTTGERKAIASACLLLLPQCLRARTGDPIWHVCRKHGRFVPVKER